MTDHCTNFPEHWVRWDLNEYKLPVIRKIYIGDCCKKHDAECSTWVFAKCMWLNRVIGGSLIVTVASLACLFKYGKV